MKPSLLKQTAYVAVISCSLGLAGCAINEQEDIVIVPDCYDEAGIECVMVTDNQTGMYLPEFASDTYTVTTTTTTTDKKPAVISAGNGDLARSRPAGDKGVSVKDKVQKSQTVMAQVETQATETKVVETKAADKTGTKVVETTVVEKTTTESTGAPVVSVVAPSKVEEKTIKTVVSQKSALSKKVAYGEECHDWEATAGSTLRTLLMDWGEKSGWTVIWKLERDYHLEAGVVFRGTFTEVSGALIRSFARATPAPIGTFYKGNRVLVINTQEDENAD